MNINGDNTFIVDGLPIPVCHFKRAYFAKLFKAEGSYGYCATKEQKYFGFKGHLLINSIGAISGFVLAAANVDERLAMREIVDNKIEGFLLGDKGYIVREEMKEELRLLNIDLQTPLRENMIDMRLPSLVRKFSRKRRLVETVIGQLAQRFNIEKNWARDVWHITNRMARKVLAHTVAVFFNCKLGREPLDFEGLVSA